MNMEIMKCNRICISREKMSYFHMYFECIYESHSLNYEGVQALQTGNK